jgi:prepilin-type N-terminal cleavage/methylation domain-containing protein
MRCRRGFTLIEMLVSVALVLFIMVILSEAFGKGLESFRSLKALGDLEARLRTTAAMLRRDLAAEADLDRHREVSCQPDDLVAPGLVYFNSPGDLVRPFADPPTNQKPRRAFTGRGRFDPSNAPRWAAVPLLADVISFDVEVAAPPDPAGEEFRDLTFDTADWQDHDTDSSHVPVAALRITLRVWEAKTKQARQVTLVQDL